MQRRITIGGLWGALILTLALGASSWGKSSFLRRTSATRAKPPVGEPVRWEYDLKAAQRISTASGKPMLIVFGAPWCTYCKKLEEETLGHHTLSGFINTSFVPLHLDFDKDRRAAQILEVKSLPMSLVLSADADLLGSVEGYVKPSQFGQVLQQSLEYQRTLSEERAVDAERRR
ncbi:MAG: thioredoxin family protein [Planctomycetaceae bacterium]